jgi:hypothetical protein
VPRRDSYLERALLIIAMSALILIVAGLAALYVGWWTFRDKSEVYDPNEEEGRKLCVSWVLPFVVPWLLYICSEVIRDWLQACRRARLSRPNQSFWKKLWKKKVPAARETFDQTNVWTERMRYESHRGPWGNSGQWRAAFREAMSPDEAKVLVGDESPWSILDLAYGASRGEIKRAWHKMAMKWHPDRNKGDEKQATEQFKRCKAAYLTLMGRA